ncbi:M3 family metallopeptidase [Paenactinomyces guangxiensis]|uniref:Peptidase M3A/M3B catalytic domain-containing protein n=1 Tax=Paenactinomyces guangxiensis TaxID=1490290 RepID=A0A7W2A9K9_9BACL|nr:M3 family metallopeptidase [Paenactinomyces guangxiensis]MBA4495379.1 hypothetical protein [Paenactinomyces guangxiensis]MBH8592500.1 hypothetical protein [Paenactinomyces guangxiensis]
MAIVWDSAWAEFGDLFADTLNHLAGFRLQLNASRGWDSILYEPLVKNRMSERSLGSLLEGCEKIQPHLVRYLKARKACLGLEKQMFFDLFIPLQVDAEKIAYDQAAHFIIEQFAKFHPGMGEFARQAFEKGWIEGEIGPEKQFVGYCTHFPREKESRIFLMYGGAFRHVLTLAHELGHAYHGYVLRNLRPWERKYPMSLAETASNFAELVVLGGMQQQAKSISARLALLDGRLMENVINVMEILARYYFELDFYRERAKGFVSEERLNELMVNAQRKVFGEGLDKYSPYNWAFTQHFYQTQEPFYNFPYTFGRLLSIILYQCAQSEGNSFAASYDALLLDTGRMSVEELLLHHLGADVTRPDFWDGLESMIAAEVDEFIKGSQSLKNSPA